MIKHDKGSKRKKEKRKLAQSLGLCNLWFEKN